LLPLCSNGIGRSRSLAPALAPVWFVAPGGRSLRPHLRFSRIGLKFQRLLKVQARQIEFDGSLLEQSALGKLRNVIESWDAMNTPIRVGAVSYLNAKPLYYGLCGYAPRVLLSMDVPSKLAEQLAAGELDVALIPSIEYLRGVGLGYEIIPGFAIAARGPVRSVKLFSRVPWDQVGRLALDAGSRTSQALAQIWLDERHGIKPRRIEELPLGVSALESTADAVLVIGDQAMRVPHEPFFDVVDLAEAWHEMTGLPFVFALWVARSGVDLDDLPAALEQSRTMGLASADELARIHGLRLGLDVATCYDYLTRVLSYELGEAELAGLGQFAAKAARLGLAPEGVSLVFHRPNDLATQRSRLSADYR
jgi:chorismate dehydratase